MCWTQTLIRCPCLGAQSRQPVRDDPRLARRPEPPRPQIPIPKRLSSPGSTHLTIGYGPAWLTENANGIRQDWPRVPLPDNAALLRASAALGARIAALLDPETAVDGVTAGAIDPVIAGIAVPVRQGGGAMSEADAVTAGWGTRVRVGGDARTQADCLSRSRCRRGSDPGASCVARGEDERHLPECRGILAQHPGPGVGLHEPWLSGAEEVASSRERLLLGRALTAGAVRYVRDVARRLAALCLMGPALDANYRACAPAQRSREDPCSCDRRQTAPSFSARSVVRPSAEIAASGASRPPRNDDGGARYGGICSDWHK